MLGDKSHIHRISDFSLYWVAGGNVARQLDLIDNLVAEGRTEFTFEEAKELLGGSRSATSNTLRRLTDNGFLDRVTHGHYAIRPLGSLGTSAVTDDLALAVGAAFGGKQHRIAYATALSGFGLFSHPVRTVMVACEQQVRISQIGNRPLRVVIERVETIHLEADIFERTWRSTLERALLESAMRVDLIGSIDRLVEALANGAREADPDRISQLAKQLGPRGLAGERRLATLAHALDLPLGLQREVGRRQPIIHLDPRDERAVWIDDTFRVVWNVSIDELRAVIDN